MKTLIPWRVALGIGVLLTAIAAISATPGIGPSLTITDVFPDRDIEEVLILGTGFVPEDATGAPLVVLGTQPLDVLQVQDDFIRATLPDSVLDGDHRLIIDLSDISES